MILLEPDVDALLSNLGPKHDGIIVWEMFKPTSGTHTNEASTKYCAQKACTYFKLGSGFDCGADIPNPTSSWEEMIEDLFL